MMFMLHEFKNDLEIKQCKIFQGRVMSTLKIGTLTWELFLEKENHTMEEGSKT